MSLYSCPDCGYTSTVIYDITDHLCSRQFPSESEAPMSRTAAEQAFLNKLRAYQNLTIVRAGDLEKAQDALVAALKALIVEVGARHE